MAICQLSVETYAKLPRPLVGVFFACNMAVSGGARKFFELIGSSEALELVIAVTPPKVLLISSPRVSGL
jgi:hypothetical protein